jgi:hypothetical protein
MAAHYLGMTVGLSALVDDLRHLGPWGLLASLELLIALVIGVNWMWLDAKAKGVAPLPYAALTMMTGSLGLLLYLVRHDGAPRRQAQDDGDRSRARIEVA